LQETGSSVATFVPSHSNTSITWKNTSEYTAGKSLIFVRTRAATNGFLTPVHTGNFADECWCWSSNPTLH